MEPLVIVIVVVAAAGAVFLWTRRRANPASIGRGEQSRRPVEPRRLVPPPEPQVLDRNTVLGRDRAFDPTNWDNTPDGSEDHGPDTPDEPAPDSPVGEDLPRFFDRDYLERKKRGETPSS